MLIFTVCDLELKKKNTFKVNEVLMRWSSFTVNQWPALHAAKAITGFTQAEVNKKYDSVHERQTDKHTDRQILSTKSLKICFKTLIGFLYTCVTPNQ